MTRLVPIAIIASCLALFTAPVDAQVLKVNPRIGMYVPLTDLGDIAGEAVALDHSLALGLGLELGVPFLPFNVRANLDYASDVAITQEGIDEEAGRTTLLAVVADAVFRLPRFVLVQPYLFAGGGLKQYDFDTADTSSFRDSSDPTLHLGGGLDLGLGSFSLNAEIGNYISWYELQQGDSQIQHDVFIMIGFSVGMF
jgi:hypothetical protein